jgi:hypothetical protein
LNLSPEKQSIVCFEVHYLAREVLYLNLQLLPFENLADMNLNSNSRSQIDGTLWLRFIIKGASGLQNSTLSNNGSPRPCYDYNFKQVVLGVIAFTVIIV